MSIGGGSSRLDNTNGSKQCAERNGTADTGSVGTDWLGPKGQVEVQIASTVIVNKSDGLIGQTVLPMNVGNTEIPIEKLWYVVWRPFYKEQKYLELKIFMVTTFITTSKMEPNL